MRAADRPPSDGDPRPPRPAQLVSTPYKCTACGNVTRFDVTTTRRSRAFHHYNLAGDLVIEEEEVLAETVEAVSCRWCGSGAAVEAQD